MYEHYLAQIFTPDKLDGCPQPGKTHFFSLCVYLSHYLFPNEIRLKKCQGNSTNSILYFLDIYFKNVHFIMYELLLEIHHHTYQPNKLLLKHLVIQTLSN